MKRLFNSMDNNSERQTFTFNTPYKKIRLQMSSAGNVPQNRNPIKLRCSNCCVTFRTYNEFRSHKWLMHDSPAPQNTNNVSTTRENHLNSKIYKCPDCKGSLFSYYEFRLHLQLKHSIESQVLKFLDNLLPWVPNQYTCNICQQLYTCKYEYDKHLSEHITI